MVLGAGSRKHLAAEPDASPPPASPRRAPCPGRRPLHGSIWTAYPARSFRLFHCPLFLLLHPLLPALKTLRAESPWSMVPTPSVSCTVQGTQRCLMKALFTGDAQGEANLRTGRASGSSTAPPCGFGCPITRRCPDLSGPEWAPEICLLNKQPLQPKDGGAAHLRMGKPRLESRVVNIRLPGSLPPISPPHPMSS